MLMEKAYFPVAVFNEIGGLEVKLKNIVGLPPKYHNICTLNVHWSYNAFDNGDGHVVTEMYTAL